MKFPGPCLHLFIFSSDTRRHTGRWWLTLHKHCLLHVHCWYELTYAFRCNRSVQCTRGNLPNKTFAQSSRKTVQLFLFLFLSCRTPLIPLQCIHSAPATKALCLQKLMESAAAVITRRGGSEDRPCLRLNFPSTRVLRHASRLPPKLLAAANVSSRRSPPVFPPTHVLSCTSIQPFGGRKKWSPIYGGLARTKTRIMTDNQVLIVWLSDGRGVDSAALFQTLHPSLF